MSLRPVAAAQSSDMAANEWNGETRRRVEHTHEVDLDSSDVEDAEAASDFAAQICDQTRMERELLAKNLAKWATRGAKFIGDAFGQRGWKTPSRATSASMLRTRATRS